MPRGRHSPTATELVTELLRRLGGGLIIIVVLAAGFWGVGQLRGDASGGDGEDPAASGQTEPGPDDATTPPGPSPTPASTPTETGTPTPSPAPGSTDVRAGEVSVQVLDAVIDDGGEAASQVASRLRDDGYDLVAENRAVRRYEQTTVFFTAGHEEEARRIASAYGFDVVEPKPDNLTDSVNVHVVVGADA